MLSRRFFLALVSAAGASTAWSAASGLQFGPAKPFSLDRLRGYAKKLAAAPFKAPQGPPPDLLRRIDYDAVQKISLRRGNALEEDGARYPISFFHMANYSGAPVVLFAVKDGMARQILYRSDYFDYRAAGIDPRPLGQLGFAGFRVMDGRNRKTDWLAFQGASYFRSSGQDGQYGASARGIAVDTGLAMAEEFPRFSQFWLEPRGAAVTIYALLEGPSLTGAYQFDARKDDGVLIDVGCDLYVRAGISRLGVAPLTSMYWYGENQKDKAADWRPEVHDSDGLAIWTGRGERIWRPLINPPQVQTNSFLDRDVKGFGLMQRDRDFDDYQDDTAFYNKRPGIWVEPKGQWGPGAVQLVEIPTADEIHDNIVAFWHPDAPVKGGDSLSYDYRLYWQDAEPAYPAGLARVIATRIGHGGASSNIPPGKYRFVIDFIGGPLETMAPRFDIMPVVDGGENPIDRSFVVKVSGTDRWRAEFDLVSAGRVPIDLRCFLRLGDKTLSETWIYQFYP